MKLLESEIYFSNDSLFSLLDITQKLPFIQLCETGDISAVPQGFIKCVVVKGAAEPPVCGDQVEKFLTGHIHAFPLAVSLEEENDHVTVENQ